MAEVTGTPNNDRISTNTASSNGDTAPSGKTTSGNDTVSSGAGDDIVYAGGGNDTVKAGRGDDQVHGGAGNDILYGEAGDDVLYGDEGNDKLFGGDGSDSLFGGSGDDVLKGGGGYDGLNGGTGRDEFVFRQVEGINPNGTKAIGDNDALRDFHKAGFDSVWQWVKVGDLSFSEKDFVRITGFDDLFEAAQEATKHNFASSTGDYIIDGQDDIDALYTFLSNQDNSEFGAVREETSRQPGITFVMIDDAGHAQALQLNGIFHTSPPPADFVPSM